MDQMTTKASSAKSEYNKGYAAGVAAGKKAALAQVTAPTPPPEKTEASQEIHYFKVGEIQTVTTSRGRYNITIEGVRLTKERNEYSKLNPKEVIFLDYRYENIDCKEAIYLSSYDFNVIDEEGNLCDTYPVSDRSRRAKEAPAGTKSKGSEAYAL